MLLYPGSESVVADPPSSHVNIPFSGFVSVGIEHVTDTDAKAPVRAGFVHRLIGSSTSGISMDFRFGVTGTNLYEEKATEKLSNSRPNCGNSAVQH